MVRISFNVTTREKEYKFGVGKKPIGVETTNTRPTRIVIAGAGYAGAACAKSLSNSPYNLKITVIDRRSASVHKIGSIRAAVLGQKYAHRVTIPNSTLVSPQKGKTINQGIRYINQNQVELEDGSTIPFDYLVCATGARNFGPGEPPPWAADATEMLRWYEKIALRIREANSITIIGGGSLGVELSGEIAYQYPEKRISIIHSGEKLLNTCHPPVLERFNRLLLSQLESLGIAVYLGQRADLSFTDFKNKPYIRGPKVVMTNKGEMIQSDLILLCTGKRLSNKIYPEEWLSVEDGSILVEATLQVQGNKKIFAVGDINSINENKQGAFAAIQGKLAATNIKRLISGSEKLKQYKPGFGTGKTYVFVALGPKRGVSNLGYFAAGSIITRLIKSKWLFTAEQWKVYSQSKNLMPDTSSYDRNRRVFSAAQRQPNDFVIEYSENESETRYQDDEDDYESLNTERYRLTPKGRKRKRRAQ